MRKQAAPAKLTSVLLKLILYENRVLVMDKFVLKSGFFFEKSWEKN